MNIARRHGWPLLAILVVAIWQFAPLLRDWPLDTHERLDPYERAIESLAEICRGFLQPQLFQNGMRGEGYAFPVFYPPLTSYVGALLTAVTGRAVLAVNLTYLLGVILSMVAMYACCIFLGMKRAIALLAAFAYLAGQYRFFQIFTRGALAESWSLVFLPLLLLGTYRLVRGKGLALLSVSVALLLLSHTLVALWVLLLMVIPAGAMLMCRQQEVRVRLKTAGWGFVAVALGFGLAAAYLVPQQVYLPTVRASLPETMWAVPKDVAANALTWSELLFLDYTGLVPWLAMFGSLLTWRSILGRQPNRYRFASAVALALSATVLLTLVFMRYPLPFIKALPYQFSYIQFPWRLLGWCQFAGAFALAAALQQIRPSRISILAVGIGIVLILLTPRAMSRASFYPPDIEYPVAGGANHDTLSGYDVRAEYLPLAYSEPVSANAVREYSPETGRLDFVIEPSAASSIVLPVVAYPFWKVKSGAKPVQWTPVGGHISIASPEAATRYQLERKYTWPWYLGWGVSAFALVILLFASRRPKRGR